MFVFLCSKILDSIIIFIKNYFYFKLNTFFVLKAALEVCMKEKKIDDTSNSTNTPNSNASFQSTGDVFTYV